MMANLDVEIKDFIGSNYDNHDFIKFKVTKVIDPTKYDICTQQKAMKADGIQSMAEDKIIYFNSIKKQLSETKEGTKIFRGMDVSYDWIKTMQDPNNSELTAGLCWSWEKYKAYSYKSPESSEKKNITIIMTARIINPAESINFHRSLLLSLKWTEDEIRLKKNCKILLKSIRVRFDDRSSDEREANKVEEIVQINKIVSTGDRDALGDPESFKEKVKIQ